MMPCRHFILGSVVGWTLLATAVFAQDPPDVLYKRGMVDFGAGNFAEAAAAFQELVDRFGEEPEYQEQMQQVQYAMGCAYFNEGAFEQAIGSFEVYLGGGLDSEHAAEVLFRSGEAHLALGQYEEAARFFQRLFQDFRGSDYAEDGFFQFGMSRFLASDYAKASEAFGNFTARYPDSDLVAEAVVYRAQSLFETDDWKQALDVLSLLTGREQTLDHVARANFLAREIGDLAFDSTDYTLALRAYRRVLTREYLLRNQQRSVDRYRAELARLRRRAAGSGNVRQFFRERTRLENGLRRAQGMLGTLEAQPPYDGALYHRIGRCFFNTDRYWEARVAFQEAAAVTERKEVEEAARFDLVLVLGRQRRFEDLIREADVYLERFEEDEGLVQRGRVPAIAYMRAEARINMEQFELAEAECRALLDTYPDHQQKARIEFYLGLSLAMQEQFEEAIARLAGWLKAYPNHMLFPEVKYWLPIARYYHGEYAEAAPDLAAFVSAYPRSVYAVEAAYRYALCLYSMEQFEEAAPALQRWIESHPDHLFQWEARITLGHALAALGRLEEAKEMYLSIPPEGEPFHFMALKECARIYRALDTREASAEMARLFTTYIRAFPDSGNVIDAAYQVGWALKHMEREDEARRFYWNVITRYGNRREWQGLYAVLGDLRALYSEMDALRDRLEKEIVDARGTGRDTLRIRLELARADVMPGEEGAARKRVLADTSRPRDLGAEELARLADVVQPSDPKRALELYRQLLKDFPETAAAAAGWIALAEIALEEERDEKALSMAEQGVLLAVDPVQLVEATFARAEALRRLRRYDDAVEAYNMVLASRSAPRALKPRALQGLGRAFEAQEDWSRALPYYQRIYVLYGAYPDAMADAYLRSAELFRKLEDRQAVIRTYEEMLANETLAARPEAAVAREKLEAMRI